MFTPPEAIQMQFTERTKQRYIPHTFKKKQQKKPNTISQVSHKRAKPSFFGHCLWQNIRFCFRSCTLKCRFERGKKAALNKSGFDLKGFTLCHSATFQDRSTSSWALVQTVAASLYLSTERPVLGGHRFDHTDKGQFFEMGSCTCVTEKYAKTEIPN